MLFYRKKERVAWLLVDEWTTVMINGYALLVAFLWLFFWGHGGLKKMSRKWLCLISGERVYGDFLFFSLLIN